MPRDTRLGHYGRRPATCLVATGRLRNVADADTPYPAIDGSQQEPERKLTTVGLAFVAFSMVAGGPFGIEAAVLAAGPLVTLLGLLIVPFIYVLPQIVIISELATMFPTNHGSSRWVQTAFGRFLGFFNCMVNVPANLVSAALYPVIFGNYMARAVWPSATKMDQQILSALCVVMGTSVALISANAVGHFSTVLSFGLIIPFAIVVFAGFHFVSWTALDHVHAIYADNQEAQYGTFVSTMLWLFTGWRAMGSVGGEVTSPGAFFKGLVWALVLGETLYFFPLLVGMSIPIPNYNMTTHTALNGAKLPWHEGYLVTAYEQIYPWLGRLIGLAGAFASLAQTACAMCVYPRVLWGVADYGYLPAVLTRRTAAGTPYVCVAVFTVVALVLCFLEFNILVRIEMLIAAPTYLLAMWALVKLRYSQPNIPRPFRWPQTNAGAIAVVCLASVIFVANVCLNLRTWYLIVIALSVHLFLVLMYIYQFGWPYFTDEHWKSTVARVPAANALLTPEITPTAVHGPPMSSLEYPKDADFHRAPNPISTQFVME